jgi:hypothetical protein
MQQLKEDTSVLNAITRHQGARRWLFCPELHVFVGKGNTGESGLGVKQEGVSGPGGSTVVSKNAVGNSDKGHD